MMYRQLHNYGIIYNSKNIKFEIYNPENVKTIILSKIIQICQQIFLLHARTASQLQRLVLKAEKSS